MDEQAGESIRAIPYHVLGLAIIVVIAYGEALAALRIFVILVWVPGYLLKKRFSGRRGQALPPQP